MQPKKRRLWIVILGLAFISLSPCNFLFSEQKLPLGSGQPVLHAAIKLTEDNAKEIRELARWGRGYVEFVDYTPDGKYLIVAASTGIYVYSADRLKLIRFIDTGEWVTAITISPDGDYIAAPTRVGAIGVWRIRNGVLRHTLEGHVGRLSSLAFSPDGASLASSASDGTLMLWNVKDEKAIFSQPISDVMDLAYSPDGQTLAVATGKEIQLLTTEDWSLQSSLGVNSDTVRVIKFSPNGKLFASGAQDGKVIVWRVNDWSVLREIKSHSWSIDNLSFGRDNRSLFSSSYDGTLFYTDTTNGDKTWSFEPGNSKQTISNAVIKDDLRTLLTVSPIGTIGRWSRLTGEWESVELDEFWGLLNRMALSPDGQSLASATQDSRIRIWNLQDGRVLHDIEILDHGAVFVMEYSPDGSQIALGYEDGMVYLLRTNGTIDWTAAIGSEVRAISFTKDKSFVAIASQKHGIQILQTTDGVKQWSIEGAGIDFNPDGKTFAVGTENGVVEIWDFGTMSRLRVLEKGNQGKTKVIISPDGNTLAANSDSTNTLRDVRLIRMNDGYFITALMISQIVMDEAFSPDSLMIATGKVDDGVVQLWRTKDGYSLARLTGHTWNVNSVSFTPDGQLLITGSNDGTIRFWGIP
jgi:WD40 repeat protein